MVAKKDIRESIIEAGQHTFTKFGFQKTTMNDIARTARKAKSSLYHYFTSKEEIFQEILEKEVRFLNEELRKVVATADTPQQKIRNFFITRMQIICNLANLYSVLKDTYFESYSFIEKQREKFYNEEVAMVKKMLSDGVEAGVFLIKNLDIAVSAIITGLKGFEYAWVKESDESTNREKIESLLDILLYGLVRR